MIDVFCYSHATFTDSWTPCPISSHVSHTLWIHQVLQDMRQNGKQFPHRVKSLATGYATCCVKGVLVVC